MEYLMGQHSVVLKAVLRVARSDGLKVHYLADALVGPTACSSADAMVLH